MALPASLRRSTTIGWPLFGRELGLDSSAEERFMLALTAPAMGSKHSMEIAQVAHHGVMRDCGVLTDRTWMSLGWAPPQTAQWTG
eukprot:2090599-Amphidinium_carterae.1